MNDKTKQKLISNPYFKTRFTVEQLKPDFEPISNHQQLDKPKRKRRRREKQNKVENQ